ncbi:MAG: RidA family protein [Lachnotalea sp.]
MGIVLPETSKTGSLFIPVRQLGNALYVSGQIPFKDGKLLYTGKVGKDLSLEEAEEAARVCIINMLAALKFYLGDLAKVKSIVKLQAFVSSEVGFEQQHIVINAASQLLIDIFGQSGRHARTAIGTNQLPMDAPVEIEAIIEV